MGNALLHYAAIYGSSSLFNVLLERSQDLDINTQARVNAETALHKAIRHGRSGFANVLLIHHYDKIDANIKDVWGKTALDRALQEEQQARSEGKTQLAGDFREVAEIIRIIELRRTNKKRQSL